MAAKKTTHGVGDIAKATILWGASTEDAARITKILIPSCNITKNSVYTYRSDLRRDGHDVPPTR